MFIFSNMLQENIILEATSTIRRGIANKRAAFAGASAMAIARHKNPAMFNQYIKYNTMRKLIKERIQRQYGPMARAQARMHRF